MLFKTHILQLPQNVNSGTLVVYLSAQLYKRAGMYGTFDVREFELTDRSLLTDLASRVSLIVAVVVMFTLIVPLKQVVNYLLNYQVILGIFSLYTFWIIIHAMIVKSYRSKLMIVSGFVLFSGVLNDVIAALSSSNNIYVSEYTLFLFLFAQTQYHSLRFVSALDIAEHLTNNLQEEVAGKTNEWSIRNRKLEDKANYLKGQHDRIKELSETDHLTGLYNRQSFDVYFELKFTQAIQQTKNLSLVMLDLDNFKKINDGYGHQVGDECLKSVADYLR
jgi:predicted signal transduction protein with EAL and GGDEF domain